MKKLLLLLIIGIVFKLNAQYYTFSKSTGTYTNLTGTTIIDNSNWTVIERGIKIPFTFKCLGDDFTDSIYLNDYGSISINTLYSGNIIFLGDNLDSRGNGKSPVSYKVEGSTPGRILKIEFRNAGMAAGIDDSLNVQCWLYETSNIIEFRYGPNKVKSSSWDFMGALIGVSNTAQTEFTILEIDPDNPTVNNSDSLNLIPMTGMPSDGIIYKFTPSANSGIEHVTIKINIIQNKISLPASVEVNSIKIYNTSGQIVQSAATASETDLSNLSHGLYVVVVETGTGLLTQKILL